ncbi:ABC transporter substrate-binding protein [Floricoccus tropicus]
MIDMTRKNKILIICITALSILIFVIIIYNRKKTTVLRLGTYSGSSWNVPNAKENKVIDNAIKRFEKENPNVKVEYESGIPKDDYSDWLSENIIKGTQPDVFIIPENDFNLLASTNALMKLDGKVNNIIDTNDFYGSTFKSGQYGGSQYALPFESNPTMMCINKDLLEKEGIKIPDSSWTLDDFYNICSKLTRDTDNNGIIDQFGSTDYTWQMAIAATGSKIFNDEGTKAYFNTTPVKKSLNFISQLNKLSGNYKVTSDDFDEGHVAFSPMTLAQYRTYKPYPYHVSKYSTFSWTCVKMPSLEKNINGTQLSTSLFGVSSKTKNARLSWKFLKLLCDDDNTQQEVFATSQGTSVLKRVMESSATKSLLKDDDFGSNALSVDTLNTMMDNAVNEPKFKKYNSVEEKADYLITKAISNNNIDTELANIQKSIEDELK